MHIHVIDIENCLFVDCKCSSYFQVDSAFNKDVVLINTDAVPSKRLVSFMNSQFHLTHLNFNFFMEGYKTSLYLDTGKTHDTTMHCQ